MNHGNEKNLIEPAGNTGVDPETAANDIRAILDAGGKGSGILAQRGALLEWAERAGRRYRESFWIAEAARRNRKLGKAKGRATKVGPKGAASGTMQVNGAAGRPGGLCEPGGAQTKFLSWMKFLR